MHLHIINYVLGITNILSNKLQKTGETLGKSSNIISSVIKTFEDSRSSESFSSLWSDIVNFSNRNNIRLEIPARSKFT